MFIGSGIKIGSGIFIGLGSGVVDGPVIGNTSSTQIPTLNGFAISTADGSPFATTVNSYRVTSQPSSAPFSYISVPGGSGFAMGTGNFTIEWFQKQTSATSFARLFWYGTSPSMGFSEEGTGYFWTPSFTSLGNYGTILNTWVHFAIVRNGNKLYAYKNGSLFSTAGGVNFTSNITDTTSTFYIGSKANTGLQSEQFIGSITSFRVCKGLAVYTGNFTTPTGPLGQTASANPYGGINTQAITNECTLLIQP